mmetsp:Transcript_147792/g.275452  ORF Transcript_147792/g.275452 Transcript_147792/m.275452 type:complete len:292 (-) Transcript_147792:852-1727(-)
MTRLCPSARVRTNFPHDILQLRGGTRPADDELLDALTDHSADCLLPQHRAGELGREQIHNERGIRSSWQGLTHGVEVHCASGWPHLWQRLAKGFTELPLGLIHQLRLESPMAKILLRLQPTGTHIDTAVLASADLVEFISSCLCSCADVPLGHHRVGHRADLALAAFASCLLTKHTHAIKLYACEKQLPLFAFLSRIVHLLSSDSHQLQAFLEAEDAGNLQRGVLANPEAGDRLTMTDCLWMSELQLLHCSKACNIDSWLAVHRVIKFAFPGRSFDTELLQIVSKYPVGSA